MKTSWKWPGISLIDLCPWNIPQKITTGVGTNGGKNNQEAGKFHYTR